MVSHPGLVPVFDLDQDDPPWAEADEIKLIRLTDRGYRARDVRKDDPPVCIAESVKNGFAALKGKFLAAIYRHATLYRGYRHGVRIHHHGSVVKDSGV